MRTLLLVVLQLLYTSATQAQDEHRPCPARSDALILASLTVHEAGWTSDADMHSIHAVLVNLAENWHVSFAEAACRHSGRFLRGETTRVWASELNEAGTAPPSWPRVATHRRPDGNVEVVAHAAWTSFQERWSGRLELARRILSSGRRHCREALTWGGFLDFSDRRRRPLRGDRVWIDVACVTDDTRNRYGYWAEIDPE